MVIDSQKSFRDAEMHTERIHLVDRSQAVNTPLTQGKFSRKTIDETTPLDSQNKQRISKPSRNDLQSDEEPPNFQRHDSLAGRRKSLKSES